MSKVLVVSDDETASVEVLAMADPTASDGEDEDPWYRATCRTPGCVWDSFVDENTEHLIEADAINDAEHHIEHDHEHAEF
jgi:hypothetical protein